MSCNNRNFSLNGYPAPGTLTKPCHDKTTLRQTQFKYHKSKSKHHKIPSTLSVNGSPDLKFLLKGRHVGICQTVKSQYDFAEQKVRSPRFGLLKTSTVGPDVYYKTVSRKTPRDIVNENKEPKFPKIPQISDDIEQQFSFKFNTKNCAHKTANTAKKRRTRLTRITKVVPTPIVNGNNSDPNNLHTYQFQQIQKHGGDFNPEKYPTENDVKGCSEGNRNYNNSRDPRKERQRDVRRHFESLISFVHLHNIMPRPRDTLPALKGFPPHCTDTVLLRMMFQMNKLESGNYDSGSESD